MTENESKLTLYNLTLAYIKAEKLKDLVGTGSTEGKKNLDLLDIFLPIIVSQFIDLYPWTFCQEIIQLVDGEHGPMPYTFAYPRPAEVNGIDAVNGGRDARWRLETDRVLVNVQNPHVTFRKSTLVLADLPMTVINVLALSLASQIAPITTNNDNSTALLQRMSYAISKLQLWDATNLENE